MDDAIIILPTIRSFTLSPFSKLLQFVTAHDSSSFEKLSLGPSGTGCSEL